MTTTAPSTWRGIDTRRVLPAADLALVTRFGEALMEADRLQVELAATLHQIRWHHTDAITVDTSPDDTEPPTGHRDPAGNAGIGPDRAAGDLKRMRRLIETAIAALDQAAAIAGSYPTGAEVSPEVEPTPGEDWCLACWKDAKYHSPVALRPDGMPRFKGLCRWCGEFRQTNRFEPPTWLLALKHRGERITDGMVDKAKEEHRRLHPKAKGKRKKPLVPDQPTRSERIDQLRQERAGRIRG